MVLDHQGEDHSRVRDLGGREALDVYDHARLPEHGVEQAVVFSAMAVLPCTGQYRDARCWLDNTSRIDGHRLMRRESRRRRTGAGAPSRDCGIPAPRPSS